MDTNRIERALHQGPPEPLYRGTSMNLVLAQADRRRGPTVASFTRLAAGLTAAIVLTAAGAVLLVALLRPAPPTAVSGPGGTSSPGALGTTLPTPATPAPPTEGPPPPATPTAEGPGPTETVQPGGPCNLGWTIDRVEGAAGSRYINVDVVNLDNPDSQMICSVPSLIGVTLKAADGSTIASTPPQGGPTLELKPGAHATGFTQWTNWCKSEPPANPLTLVIQDRDGVPIEFTSDPPPCNGPGKPTTMTPIELSAAP